jgi:hypothetical protein
MLRDTTLVMTHGRASSDAGEALSEAARALLTRGNALLQKEHGPLQLRAGVGQRHAASLACVTLESVQGRLLVALEQEQTASPLGDAHWQDYAGDARLLAWSLAHEPLLDSLSRVFGGGFLPTGFMARGDAAECLWLALTWRGENDQSLQGWLGLGVTEARLLAGHPDWKRDPSALSMLGDASVLTFELMLQGRAMAPATAASLASGDVLLIGIEPDCDAQLQPDRETLRSMFGLPAGWAVQRRQRQWTIAAKAMASTVIDPNRPRFRLGRLSLSPEQVGALQPGSVLSYDASLLGNTVDILFGEQRFGEGVIVALGEWLGVRISGQGIAQKEPSSGL